MILPPEILAILAEQERQIARVNPRHRAKLVQIGVDLAAELAAALKRLSKGRYREAEVRTIAAQVRALLSVIAAKYGEDVGGVVQAAHEQGAGRGRASLQKQLEAWDAAGLLPGPKVRTEAAAELLDPGLLDLHDASMKAYGEEVIAKMRMTLARGQLANETVIQTADRLAQDLAIPDWRAERIVRTEHSFALHRRQILDLIDTFGNDTDAEWRKQLVTTFDDRTGEDSKFVDGQIRRIDEEFVDNEDRHYQHPPNRPNDRETVVFVPTELAQQIAAARLATTA